MNNTQTTPAREEEYAAQIEATRYVVEGYARTNMDAYFDAYDLKRQLGDLRGKALQADLTMLQEMKAHKNISRLVRKAEKLQAEVAKFQAALRAVTAEIED
jgi:hypothetical protein